MKNKINKLLPNHILVKSNAKELFVVDYKNYSIGDVSLLEKKPTDIKCVSLNNQNEVSVWFDGFKENALPIKKGQYNRQCECVIFPETCKVEDWVLFIEIKYSDNIQNAFRVENNYPYCMVEQIVETINYFRTNNILESNKRATAIVSFPNLMEEFSGFFFDFIDATIEDILSKYKILIYPTNSVKIISNKRIKLN